VHSQAGTSAPASFLKLEAFAIKSRAAAPYSLVGMALSYSLPLI